MKDITLKEKERLEDLQLHGLKIIQSDDGYRFTSDAVLLANCVKNVKGQRIVELCGGCGVISILIAYKQKPKSVACVEIQPRLADMAARSVEICGLGGTVEVVCADLKGVEKIIGKDFDAVAVNPPYKKLNSGAAKTNEEQFIARQEVKTTLAGIVCQSALLLKSKGWLYMVHQVDRLAEVLSVLREKGLEPKELTFIKAREKEKPNLFIVRALKDGKTGLIIKEDIVMFDNLGNYTKSVKDLYGVKED